jgi:hypothetical protein
MDFQIRNQRKIKPVILALQYSHCVWYSHETGKANKMCLTETYSRVRVGNNLSDMFPIRNVLKQGSPHSPLFFNFDLDGIRLEVNADKTTDVVMPRDQNAG